MDNNTTSQKSLRILLLVHGLITLAAGIVLIFRPPLIPRTVHIEITPNAYLLCYLLGAAELSLAFLSLSAIKLKDLPALRLISVCFILFHLMTGVLEAVAYKKGADSLILVNILARILISLLFGYFGIYRLKIKRQSTKVGKAELSHN